MTLRRTRNAIISISLLVLSGGIGYWAGQREIAIRWAHAGPQFTVVNKAVPPEHQNVDFSLFWDVWDRLNRDYLDKTKLDDQAMVNGAISGMVASLGDPYTVYLPPKDQKESRQELAGAFEGVGIQLGVKDGKLTVIAPLDGMPAKAAGIEAGDFILRIQDQTKNVDKKTDGMALPEAVDLIRGPKGQSVTLTIARSGRDPFEVTLKRDTIVVKSVTLEWIETGSASSSGSTGNTSSTSIAYVRLSRFGDRTGAEWNDVVDQIIKRSNSGGAVSGMVLDVRSNPGGYLDAAVVVASEFFRDGVVVEQKGLTQSHSFTVDHPGRFVDIPLVVLVDRGSASAAEIVSGAIQARGRGKLVGENTFGKGTVQDAQELRGGAGLHITTARWLLPNGNWIQEEGLKPDVTMEYDEEASKDQKWDNQVKKAIEVLLSNSN